MKSENHEICQYLMISYMEVVETIEWVSQILSYMMLTDRNIREDGL
jgi:hypothetical protein